MNCPPSVEKRPTLGCPRRNNRQRPSKVGSGAGQERIQRRQGWRPQFFEGLFLRLTGFVLLAAQDLAALALPHREQIPIGQQVRLMDFPQRLLVFADRPNRNVIGRGLALT
jgi:hypothetical protein